MDDLSRGTRMNEILQRLLSINPANADDAAHELFVEVREALRTGVLRAAHKVDDTWVVDLDVKRAILWGFRAGVLIEISSGENSIFSFTDKHTLPVQRFTSDDERRIVPGGTTIRDGAHVARGVIVMPPAYINIGAFVDEDTLVDSHALVGSCAQIGKRVHLSAGVQIGGVLEPVGAVPVVIEDDVMIGGNCGIYEGAIVRRGAVVGTGVILNASTPVYDLVRGRVLRKGADGVLEIPPGAVVVPGSRPASGEFARSEGVHVYTPIIVKYRDERTNAATSLEVCLR